MSADETGSIYCVRIGPKYYYGQSIEPVSRRNRHLSDLKGGRHCNRYMQAAWDKHLDFSFEIVEQVPRDLLDETEQGYIDRHIDEVHCMNLRRDVGGNWTGRKHRKESIHQNAMSQPGRKQIVVTYKDGRVKEYPSIAQAAKHMKTSKSHLSAVLNGKRPPVKYTVTRKE